MAEGGDRVVVILPGQVEVIQGAGHQDVGVGVKTTGELAALVAQVALYLELHIFIIQKKTIDREYSCKIEPNDVERIMLMEVKSSWKILLLMGIGVFTNNHDNNYTEIMKQLATQQKLYMVVASSDYIYGTNYQFCHGYISKDLNNMTQEKTIQALGRIGRNQLGKDYSIRFRDDSLIEKIFVDVEERPEVENMNKLFNTPI